MATTKEVKSALNVMIAVTETIRESGEIPSGTLYAVLMSKGCDFQTYEAMERTLLNTGLIEKRGDLLRWIGPRFRTAD